MSRYDIDIMLEVPQWAMVLPTIETLATDILTRTLDAALPKNKTIELSVVLANDEFVRDLNARYRGQDKPTNVLSFPMTEPQDLKSASLITLGDIVIAYETTAREAADQKKPLRDHLIHLLVHGCLHLLHHDHEDDDQAKVMESLEVKILAGMGVKNPYETL